MGRNFQRWMDLLDEALEKMGRPQATPAMLKERLENAGFVDVQIVTGKQPFGPWPKEKRMKTVGAMVMLNADTGCEAYGMAPFTRILGMDKDEATKTCRDAFADIKNKNYHMYTPL
jgi:hypothetical protein